MLHSFKPHTGGSTSICTLVVHAAICELRNSPSGNRGSGVLLQTVQMLHFQRKIGVGTLLEYGVPKE